MKKLNPTNAKKIAFAISKKIQPPEQRDFFLIHSQKVVNISKLIAKKINFGRDIFEIAGWIHDIGYSKNIKTHSRHTIPILHDLGYEIDNILKDCILNHGSDKKPKTIEGKIFQLADKLSIFDYDLLKIILQQETFPPSKETIAFLKTMSENSLKLLKNFN